MYQLLHIAASEGNKECVLLLLRHSCNVHIQDVEGDTALWHAISANHHNIFQILYHCATISDSYTPGYLLCTAAKRNDIRVMKALLRHGLNVDSKDRSGLTAIEIAMSENHVDMVDLLVMNGTDVTDANKYEFCSSTLNGMLRKREVGHRIMVEDTALDELPLRAQEREQGCRLERSNGPYHPRVRIYRGHPMVKKEGCCVGNGRLTRLPSSLVELKRIAGEKFGFDARNATVIDGEGAEIDSIDVIRDNDKIFLVEEQSPYH